jgi:predicted DNA-binding protein
MEVHFAPETEEKLRELAAQSGLGTPDELVREVVEGYFDEVSELGAMLSSRYEDLRSGRIRVMAGAEVQTYFRKKSDGARASQSQM